MCGWCIVLGILLLIAAVVWIVSAINGYSPRENWYGNGTEWSATDDFEQYYAAMPTLRLKSGQDKLKIMQLADPQLKFGSFTQDTKTMELIGLALDTEQPDIVVCTGDLTFSLFAGSALKYFCDFMEERQVYWAFTYGNHDSELSLSKYRHSQMLAKYDYCLFDGGPSNIKGESNYFVKVVDEQDNLLYALSLLDSNMYPDERNGLVDTYYDEITAEQAEWYAWCIKGLQSKRANVQSSVFIHMPLRAYVDMYNDESVVNKTGGVYERPWILSTSEGDIQMPGIYCQTGNAPSATSGGAELYSAIVSCASTKAVFCGHDHINTLRGVDSNGILLAYGRGCGYHTYPFFDKKGESPFWEWVIGIPYATYTDTQLYLDCWRDEDGNALGKGMSFIEVELGGEVYGKIRMYDRNHEALSSGSDAIQLEIVHG